MIYVIMDQLPLSFRNGFFDGVKLLGKVKAWSAFLEHRYDAPDMSLGPLEPFDDICMTFMDVHFRSYLSYPLGGDTASEGTLSGQ